MTNAVQPMHAWATVSLDQHVAGVGTRQQGRVGALFNGAAFRTCVGVLYVSLTLLASVRFLNTSEVTLANDYFWVGFNASVGAVFLANAVNGISNGVFGRSLTTTLTNETFVVVDSTPLSARTISFPSTYARMVQYHRLTSIEDGIMGLRQTKPMFAASLPTQYCWVDFEQRWSLAHTQARAARCTRHYTDNGAVYLESLLRNIDWAGLMAARGRSLESAVLEPIRGLPGGESFLDSLRINGSITLEEEATYWRSKGILQYQLQYANWHDIGIDDKIEIVNAFGLRNQLTIKKSSYTSRSSSATTVPMYWLFLNDLWASVDNNTRISGLSLVRNASDFFENAGITMEQVLVEDGDIESPFSAQHSLWRDAIGPFNSVDMHWRMYPGELFDLVQRVRQTVFKTALALSDTHVEFWDVNTASGLPLTPRKWRDGNWSFLGGSPLCGQSAPVNYVMQQFQFGDTCTAGPIQENAELNPLAFVFIALVSGLSSNADIMDVCAEGTTALEVCRLGFQRALGFVDMYVANEDRQQIQTMAVSARSAVRALNISILQFAERTTAENTTEQVLLLQPLLPESPTTLWEPFGWIYLFNWVSGDSEVVTFEGDDGTLTLISTQSRASSYAPSSTEVLVSVAPYLLIAVQYVTGMLVVVATIVLWYALLARFQVAGGNLLGFSRTVGVVWVGRPMLVLRGLVAIAILSTSSPIIVQQDQYTVVTEASYSGLTAFITAGESTWLLIVAADLLVVLTTGWAHIYAPLATVVVWVSVAALQITSPMKHSLKINPKCSFVAPDKQITCLSGVIVVGSSSRFVLILSMVGAGLVLCYLLARILFPRRPRRRDSQYLPGIAIETYAQDGWIHNDRWYIDTASAAMAGIISVRIGRISRAIDVKSWAALHIDLLPKNENENEVPSHMRRSIHLKQLKIE